MGKSTHFNGQPMFGQLADLLDRKEILRFSREVGGERYVKKFDAWHHLLVMLYATIERFDSLREITSAMDCNPEKFAHLGIKYRPRRSTLSDANARRSDKIFEHTYHTLYERYLRTRCSTLKAIYGVLGSRCPVHKEEERRRKNRKDSEFPIFRLLHEYGLAF